jgi:hypothetical protein
MIPSHGIHCQRIGLPPIVVHLMPAIAGFAFWASHFSFSPKDRVAYGPAPDGFMFHFSSN